jgi:hypothetical protein
VTDAKRLASYNWIAAKTPTIVVPGLPPIWRKINVPSQVKKDNGLVYTAQNNARHPESPLEPLFRALYLENPSFDISSVDVISDRSNILKLLSFVDPRSNIYGVRDFSMRMELVDGTAIFHRLEAKTKEFIRQSDETSVCMVVSLRKLIRTTKFLPERDTKESSRIASEVSASSSATKSMVTSVKVRQLNFRSKNQLETISLVSWNPHQSRKPPTPRTQLLLLRS